MQHELKTDPDVFDLVESGEKTFEIRWNDRNFQTGDYILLKKTKYSGVEMIEGKPLEYTGDNILLKAKHVMHGPVYGLSAGWVIISIEIA